ncbi:MAG: DUF6515 family protein [Pseudomonadota bacterium]
MHAHGKLSRIAIVLLALGASAAFAAGNPDRHRNDDNRRSQPRVSSQIGARVESRIDDRYRHNRSYPSRGYVAPALPLGYYPVRYRGSPYYYSRGAWYRPYGPRFVVVAPPIGIGVGFLPPYYTRVWFGGMPYYYADDTYYQWRPERREYVVSQPPGGEPRVDDSASQGSDEIFVYPKNGQSEEQQATDRYECHAWAVGKTGFDPTRPSGNVDDSEITSKNADYRRAEGACLEARGYSVK